MREDTHGASISTALGHCEGANQVTRTTTDDIHMHSEPVGDVLLVAQDLLVLGFVIGQDG